MTERIIAIPARLNSTRLKNKLLLDLCGKSIIRRVYENCTQVPNSTVIIVTDSPKIESHCRDFCDNIFVSQKEHSSGTDRISEVLKKLNYKNVVNVQGDEPFINSELIERLFFELGNKTIHVVTACVKINSFEDLENPNVVKIVKDLNNNAMYFSRAKIPFLRIDKTQKNENNKFSNLEYGYKHIGIYGYSNFFFNKIYDDLKQSTLEKTEMLEQLRLLENSQKIRVIETENHPIGIDTHEDFIKAKCFLANNLN